MVTNLLEYLSGCPFLHVNGQSLSVDYLAENPTGYSIDFVASQPTVKKYTDCGEIRQQLFYFRCLQPFDGNDVNQAVQNYYLFTSLSEWLDKNAPNRETGWLKVEALTNGYLQGVSEGADKAIYQIQCRILYNYNM